MTEFEQEVLAHMAALTAAVENLQAALGEHSADLVGMREKLDEFLRRPLPNVAVLLQRVKKAEGEVSELDGKVMRLRTDFDSLASAAGGRGAP